MKKFILLSIGFVLATLICFLAILSTANGRTDPFYIRFTTPPQENLIIGTSRAAQGVVPSVLKDKLGVDMFNYSFTILQSPFGPTYLNSIKKKLKENTTNGTFIITVDPWSISSSYKDPNNVAFFKESELCLGNTHYVNMNPNFDYLINNMKGEYLSILTKRNHEALLHEDGWLEVSPNMDAAVVAQKTNNLIAKYQEHGLNNNKFSALRFEYLIKTIDFLKAHGQVYLVRLPVHPRMMEIEEQLMPDFNAKLNEISTLTEGYYDLTYLNDSVLFTDGNHLYKESGKYVSAVLADWILTK